MAVYDGPVEGEEGPRGDVQEGPEAVGQALREGQQSQARVSRGLQGGTHRLEPGEERLWGLGHITRPGGCFFFFFFEFLKLIFFFFFFWWVGRMRAFVSGD